MVTKTVKVVNEQGMHMRPAGVLAQEMKKFAGCTVKGGRKRSKGNIGHAGYGGRH